MTVDAARIRPFPWGAFHALTRTEAATWNDLLRWIAGHAHFDSLRREIESLVGDTCQFRPHRVRLGDRRDIACMGIGVILAGREDSDRDAVLLDVEPELASLAVARVTKRDVGGVPTRRSASPTIAGAFAAIVATALRRAHTDTYLRVVAAGTATDLLSRIAVHDNDWVLAHLTIVLGREAFDVRVAAPRSVLAVAPALPWSRARLGQLGPVPIALPVVAFSGACSASEIARLRIGDAIVPPAWTLRRTHDDWVGGPVWLASPCAELGVSASIEGEGRLVLGSGQVNLDGPDSPMRCEDVDAVVATVGDAMVSVRVEIATAMMTAREWASLGPGAVVQLGQRVGNPVTIRVGGIAIASGELIDIDGEVGVRILSRTSEAASP